MCCDTGRVPCFVTDGSPDSSRQFCHKSHSSSALNERLSAADGDQDGCWVWFILVWFSAVCQAGILLLPSSWLTAAFTQAKQLRKSVLNV